ncbi:methylmalonyl-CoA epimerase [Frankia sp. Cppng1_Ct_nod]|uniref:methylmalonyl-CoA epimerase n=1 Tax=Frankia sp. Cppng1_Ct_nod TaxID=2897162 RepID=UPI0020250B6B|nr:methylmalonyl-CoA epimerase [Frankia sp. Cppng1_Ct_nod]
MFTRIDHVGIAVRDLEKSIVWYQTMFGLTVVAQEINEEQSVHEAMLLVDDGPQGGSHVQLLEPTRQDSPVGKYLARHGEGMHHIAYGVDDVEAAIATMATSGIRVLDRKPRHGAMNSRIAFMHPKDTGGVLTELVQAVKH